MVPPRWPDEQGRPIPTYPCPRCGLEVASRFRGFRVENLRHVGWQLFRAETYVNWCGHAQEIIPLPGPTVALRSCRCWGRRADGLRDLRAT
jgi:hypothetical protein